MPTTPVATFALPVNTTQLASTYKANIDGDMAVAQRIIDNFAPRQTGTPAMTISLDAGSILIGTTLTEVASQTSGTITAPASGHNRIDRAVISATAGTLSIITGTPTTGTPSAPAITAGNLPVAQISLTGSTATIINSIITDERNFWGIGNLSALLDSFFGNTQGDILYRGTSAWTALAPGSNGQYLQTQGASANPQWATISTTPNYYQAEPSNPSATSSSTPVMMGLAGSITPASSGDVMIVISGDIQISGSIGLTKIQLSYGTSTAPSNGTAVTGTQAGSNLEFNPSSQGGNQFPFSVNAIIPGLALSTAYWLDLAVSSASTATLKDISISAYEIK
jgi:hypothetical protein